MRSLVVGLALSLACSTSSSSPSPPPPIKATDFDQSCGSAADCIPIYEGNACCSGCPSAAINRNDQAKYQQEVQAHADECKGVACPAIACEWVAVCKGITCAIETCGPSGCPDAAPPKDASGE